MKTWSILLGANEILVRGDDPTEFEFGVFKIQDEADGQSGCLEIIQHLADFVIGDALNDFRVNDHLAEGDQVGNVFRNLLVTVYDRVAGLLKIRDATILKLNDHGIFVGLFVITVADIIQNGKRATDDGVGFLLAWVICVHLRPSAVNFLFIQEEARRVR